VLNINVKIVSYVELSQSSPAYRGTITTTTKKIYTKHPLIPLVASTMTPYIPIPRQNSVIGC